MYFILCASHNYFIFILCIRCHVPALQGCCAHFFQQVSDQCLEKARRSKAEGLLGDYLGLLVGISSSEIIIFFCWSKPLSLFWFASSTVHRLHLYHPLPTKPPGKVPVAKIAAHFRFALSQRFLTYYWLAWFWNRHVFFFFQWLCSPAREVFATASRQYVRFCPWIPWMPWILVTLQAAAQMCQQMCDTVIPTWPANSL